MKKLFCLGLSCLTSFSVFLPSHACAQAINNNVEGIDSDMTLIWHDEFDTDGQPDSTRWNYERGFVRNKEMQWYAPENAYQRDGLLVLEARPAAFACPTYEAGSRDWRKNRPNVQWTSAAVETRESFSYQYGRLEVKARIPVCLGAWPAIWLMGKGLPWPSNGEVDLMEYYQSGGKPTVLANAAWGSDKPGVGQWDSSYTPLTHFTEKDPMWASRFHVWTMDWDENFIRLYLDGELLNETDLQNTVNGKANGEGVNPFRRPMYLLLNLALDTRVKDLDVRDFPMRYEIDYVRVYQKTEANKK